YASANWARVPDVNDPTPGSNRELDVDSLSYAFALGWKAIESWDNGYLHDVHVYAEFGGFLDGDIVPAAAAGEDARVHQTESFVFAPGIRYGFKTPANRLFEIGISVPIGIDRDAADWAVLVQLQ